MDRRLWLRWSWRDLRRRRVQVVAIAVVIAIGTGLATGLSSVKTWRIASNDASFAALRYHAVRATLPEGGFAPEGSLARAVARAPGAAAVRERLVLPTQVDASRRGKVALVPGVLIGQRIDPRPVVDGLGVDRGRLLRPGENGAPVAMLDHWFAAAHGLPPSGTVRLAGGRALRYVGWAFQPQYFLAGGGDASFGLGAAGFAPVFTSLATAQRIAGRPGAVNEVVVRGRPGVGERALAAQVHAALAASLPGAGATITRGSQEPAYRLLYKDADGDQKVYAVLAVLVLLGAALAAYNLTSRTVQAQRREIGIGMALGAPPARLALRPLLMGLEIAVLGALLGVGMGLAVERLYRSLLVSMLPLPVNETPFQLPNFLAGAALGVALPLLGVALPVRRAVRMRPIEAIRVGFRAAAGGGLAPLLARLPLPGDSLAQMPLRNVVRAPRRTLVTVLGIGLIVALVVTFSGLIDSFLRPLDRARAEVERVAPGRLTVSLDRFRPAAGPEVRRIARDRVIASARPQSHFPVTLSRGRRSIDAVLTVFDPGEPGWLPSIRAGSFGPRSGGILLAPQAAEDLGVRPGEPIAVRHPRLEAGGRVGLATSTVRVDGLHGGTLRTFAFGADAAWGRLTGLRGLANQVDVIPARGVSSQAATRALFALPGVASVQSPSAPFESIDDYMDRFLGFIYATEAFILLLALLVAFNSAAISADERRREHATMFAYGVPVRSVLLQGVAENGVLGLLAAAVGVLVGLGLVGWMVATIIPQTVPDLEVTVVVSARTLLVAAVVGVVACALAPLLTARRLRRMDVASTLRVME